MFGKSSINLTALTTYESPKSPRPHCDLFHPEIFEPANRLIVFTNASIEVVVFVLAFLSVSVLNQQEFREEPVPDSISRNFFLSRCRFWSGRLPRIPAVSCEFSGRDGWFSARLPGARSPRFIGLVSIVVGHGFGGCSWVFKVRTLRLWIDFLLIIFHGSPRFDSGRATFGELPMIFNSSSGRR